MNTRNTAAAIAIASNIAFWTLFLFNVLPVLALICGGVAFVSAGVCVLSPPPSIQRKAIESSKVDGRTHDEWYELIKGMGREEYEKLARPALDGLEGSSEGIGGWDLKKTLGQHYYNKIMREWYPENYCKICGFKGCNGKTCGLSFPAKPVKIPPATRVNHTVVTYNNSTASMKVTAPAKKVKPCQVCAKPGCASWDCVKIISDLKAAKAIEDKLDRLNSELDQMDRKWKEEQRKLDVVKKKAIAKTDKYKTRITRVNAYLVEVNLIGSGHVVHKVVENKPYRIAQAVAELTEKLDKFEEQKSDRELELEPLVKQYSTSSHYRHNYYD